MTAPAFRARLSDRLADSLTAPIPAGTSRRIYGRVTLPRKATAVVGMRRAGKTTFLHQLRRERLERGQGRERLPYIIVAQPAYEWLLAAPGED